MSITGSWLSSGFNLINPNKWGLTKEKKLRNLRQQINEISNSRVLDEADIDDAQILTLTREELSELYPGIKNFNLRRTIMTLITEAKDSPQPGPETFDRALKHLMQKNSSNDAAVLGVLKESLQAFKEMEEKLKAAQQSLKPYIEILNSFIEQSARKPDWETEPQPHTSSRRKHPSPSQTNSSTMKIAYEPPVRVNVHVSGRLFGVERQVLGHLRGIEEAGLQDCRLILVFYPIISRAGTDTDDVLRQIPANKPVALVTMHHTFNPDYVCPSVNIRSAAANIVKHVNVLFHDSCNGFLNCPANDFAITQLQSILSEFK